MSGQEAKQQQQFKAILERMLQEPENKVCADCHSSGIGSVTPILMK